MAKNVLDVAIVGAGLAGLVAARDLKAAGLAVALFEARERVGGRVFTETFPGTQGIVEWGAEWIVPHLHTTLVAEARRYGIQPEPVIDPAAPRWCIDGQMFEGGYAAMRTHQPGFSATLDHIERDAALWCHDRSSLLNWADRPMREYLASIAPDQLAARMTEAAFFAHMGADPSEVATCGLWDEVRYHGGSIDGTIDAEGFRVAGGAMPIAEQIAKTLGSDLHLSAPVEAIEVYPESVVLLVKGQRREARRVIVALPALALRTIQFDPPLSDRQMLAAAQGNAGQCLKLNALAEGEAPAGLVYLSGHPFGVTYGKRLADGRTLLIAPSLASSVNRMNEGERRQCFEALYPGLKVLTTQTFDWTADRYVQGSWQTDRTGFGGAVHQVFSQQRGPVSFAGGDFTADWSGWMEGALRSGTSVAERIRTELQTTT